MEVAQRQHQPEKEEGLKSMVLSRKDRQGEGDATDISLSTAPSSAAIYLLSWPPNQKSSYLRQLVERAKREYSLRSIAGSSVDVVSSAVK